MLECQLNIEPCVCVRSDLEPAQRGFEPMVQLLAEKVDYEAFRILNKLVINDLPKCTHPLL